MKKVKFLKDHPSGIAADAELSLETAHADRLAAEGYVEIVSEGAPSEAGKASSNKKAATK